ncbi:MAG: NUDIX domain-containing protein [Chloroflexota bacterium]
MIDESMAAVGAVRAGRTGSGDVAAAPVFAATVVLLRPGPHGPEVLITQRPASMAFAANVYVFPGGRVDPADARPDHPLADGLTAADAAQRLAGTLDPIGARAHHVAAVRETLEETGIRVTATGLVPLTRWVTPASLVRRFDVRFFAAAVAAAADVLAPSSEVAAYRWVTPADALSAAHDGRLAMLLPTLVTFEQLNGLPDLAAVAAAFRPGSALGPPVVGDAAAGVAVIEQRWAGGIAGRSAPGWLVGHRDVVLVDPADPTGETMAVVDAALAERGARLVGIALTGRQPEQHAGVELYAAGRTLPVAGGPGGRTSYPMRVIRPGDVVPFGDVRLVGDAGDADDPRHRGDTPHRAGAGAIAYRLPDGRLLPPRLGDRLSG